MRSRSRAKKWRSIFREARSEDPSAQGRQTIAAHLDVLETRLQGKSWLVEDYSLADVCYAPLVTVFDRIGLEDLLQSRPAVRAWVERLCLRPAVRDTAPSVS